MHLSINLVSYSIINKNILHVEKIVSSVDLLLIIILKNISCGKFLNRLSSVWKKHLFCLENIVKTYSLIGLEMRRKNATIH
jgi:hypothetical protein